MQSGTLKEECERVLDKVVKENQVLDKKTAIRLFLDNRSAKAIFSALLQVY